MRERDPGVLVIPDQRRHQAKRESAQEQAEAGPFEFAAMPRDERENENDRNQFERIGVFAKKAEADQQPSEEPERFRVRGALEREPEAAHGGDPEKNRERVDRHDEIADVEKWDGVEREDGPERGALGEQSLREIKEEESVRGAQNRAPKPNPK